MQRQAEREQSQERRTQGTKTFAYEGAYELEKGKRDDAGFDLRAIGDHTILSGNTKLIPTSIYLQLEAGWEAQVRPRGGTSYKTKLRVANTPGTVDAGYRGEICIIAENTGSLPLCITDMERIAQLVIKRVPDVNLVRVDSINKETERGDAKLNSTGTH